MFRAKDNKDINNWSEFYFRSFSEFLNHHQFKDEQDCRLYLNKLKPACRDLWSSYKNKSGNITPDYSSSLTQEAYFLRYGPLYSHSINHVLNHLYNKMDIDPFRNHGLIERGYLPRTISIYSAGPATEIWGFLKFFMETYNPYMDDYLTFNTVDRFKWSEVRLMSENPINDYLKKWHLDYKENTGPKIFHSQYDNLLGLENSWFKSSNFILFQNCLNEYLSQRSEEVVLNFLSSQLNNLEKNGILLFSEITNYNSTNLLESFFNQNNEEIELIFKDSFELYPYAMEKIPSIISEELLTGEHGLIPSLKNKIEVTVYRKKDYSQEQIREYEMENNYPQDWEIERDQMNSASDPLWSEDESASDAWDRGQDQTDELNWDDDD